jgi:hypothetical protein
MNRNGLLEIDREEEEMEMKKEKDVVLLSNEYPYWVEPFVCHEVLWAMWDLSNDCVKAFLEPIMRQRNREFVFFANVPGIKSIPNLFHVQTFSRRKV